jgi:hypothetical protein
MLVYRGLVESTERETEAQRREFAAFSAALDSAPGDDDRVALIHGVAPAFLAEWSWRCSADSAAWAKRYLVVLHTHA